MAVLSNTDCRTCDSRITFQEKVQTQNPTTGELAFTWQNVSTIGSNGTIWASINAVKASERFVVPQELAGSDYTIWIRWRDDIDTNMRIVWGDRVMDITGIPDNQRRGRWLSIFCTQGLNDG
jgi:SPP1 family predicted phage head-tail adaptor